ncbi:MAG TPA: sugar phosphate isomerase/epimerase [Candidatus Limnocylindria bacterium]|nr:sugar phosphate isomerase/epimerase [Candidatus Limnocylindria bacterium]
MTIVVANAPVSYGAFELTVGGGRYLADPARVLDEVAAAGYAGIDLGPLGYLAPPERLAEELAGRGLGLAGGYIELPFGDPASLDAVLATFARAAPQLAGPPPRPTLAAAARSAALDEAGWHQFGEGLRLVVGRCRQAGFEPAFHHHAGTLVETPAEIERVLALSDVGLCLDTGHLLVAGGDPVVAVREWQSRINQVHLKDASARLIDGIRVEGAPAAEIWQRSVFRPLGDGGVDLEGVLSGLREIGYAGWAVVEQDVLVGDETGFERAAADQRANRRFLTERGL